MSFDFDELARAIEEHGAVARVVVAEVRGSAPREVGASMLVWPDGMSGTIGGGALEFAAMERARRCLQAGQDCIEHIPLGPAMGQCCGGNVSLLTEVWDVARLATIDGPIVARRCPGRHLEPSPAARQIGQKHQQGISSPRLVDGWMIEPLVRARRAIWLYGAGHVGRAITSMLAPLPDFAVTWIDTHEDRFPALMPDGADRLVAAAPAAVVKHAPTHAEHIVLTYSHPFDLAICEQLLRHSFRFAGLIGSKTKWARFRKRLVDMGFSQDRIGLITCPIGYPSLGKHPHAIAVGVVADLLRRPTRSEASGDSEGCAGKLSL